ncbi:MAG: hypothetical protein WAO76_10860 [Georgfuchsia sp.]
MPNVIEATTYEYGIYQIETTDPVLGGADGIANVQARQLANRTKYLKQFADEVAAARGGQASIDARFDAAEANIAGLDPDMQNAVAGAIKYALDQVGVANRSVKSLKQQLQQEGVFTLTNRGIISGGVTAKKGASRLLTITAGSCFIGGRRYSIAAADSGVSVPNGSGVSETCTGYIYLLAGIATFTITNLSQAVPAGGIPVCTVVVPAGSINAALADCTLTDVRRVEPGYPISLDAPASQAVSLNTLSANDYRIDFDVISFTGARCTASHLVASSRATNGFTAYLHSAADDVVVRWRASKLNN